MATPVGLEPTSLWLRTRSLFLLSYEAINIFMYNLAIPGWMPEGELKILEALALKVPKGGTIVEIGPFCGRSSWCWAKTAPTATVYCLDPWDPVEHPFHPPVKLKTHDESDECGSDFGKANNLLETVATLKNFKLYTADCPNIVPMQGYSPTDFKSWSIPADLIFLDGLHHNPGFAADLHFWFWHVKKGGIICGDDCARTHPDVLWTIHDFAKDLGLTFSVTGRIWQITR